MPTFFYEVHYFVFFKEPYGDNLCEYLMSGVQNPKWRTIIKELGVKIAQHISSLESTMQNSV